MESKKGKIRRKEKRTIKLSRETNNCKLDWSKRNSLAVSSNVLFTPSTIILSNAFKARTLWHKCEQKRKKGHLLFITFLVVEMRVKIKKKKRKMTKPCTENNGKTQRVFEAKIGK